MAYYDEFQQLMLKLDHRGEQVSHDIVRFKVGLNKDISTHITLHKLETIEGIFKAALEVEKELKERSGYKFKGQSPSGWHKDSDHSFNAEQPETKAVQTETKTAQKYPPRNEGKPNPSSHPKGLQCFKCQGWGHKASECPNRRNVILREGKLYYLGEEVGTESYEIDGKPQDGEQEEIEVQNEEYRDDVWPHDGA
ncbi:uncharacterized protein LOC124892198, partial [Capsicum annuum]|uniref:uncharacterized protein LOC124892198 n=1 Tax=Capsicum annuum TaxID=4072 RepID=UPI001FB04DA5